VVDLVLFDLAGTTVRDDGFVLGAFRSVAAGAGLSQPDEWFRVRMGLHKVAVFRELLHDSGRHTEDAQQLAELFDETILHGIADRGVAAMPGAADTIDLLRRSGVSVGFTTGFGSSVAEAVVRAAGFPDGLIVASDQVGAGRPAPDMIFEGMRRAGMGDASCVGVVGDTPSDLIAGMRAGCGLIVGVGCGSHTLDELAAHPHTHLLADLAGFEDLVLGASL
jgi:phosphonatase-like hydrolase